MMQYIKRGQIRPGGRCTSGGCALSADRNGVETEYMTLMMRDLENQELGKEEQKREHIADMLKKGKTPQAIADFCDYPIKLIQEVQNSLLVAK